MSVHYNDDLKEQNIFNATTNGIKETDRYTGKAGNSMNYIIGTYVDMCNKMDLANDKKTEIFTAFLT